ncbi:metal ABC transporter permease [Achromobacter sp. GG226]|uniref:metal ABC transporter permease n=1 Tax=Verticiella alkaliphila TaxID=2779529 RepID=UPI001C0B130C|nr:metal ABC transporter permease [Verticiella sp. GG226]MBU4609435.1 metal ABC transporter permease [Verticiella sp. GG226]
MSLDLLLQPLAFDFMQQALLISVLVAVPTALLSCFLVLRGWALMGDAISHAVLPGIVLAYLAGIPLAVGAFAAGMTCAIGTGYLQANSRLKQDTVMGAVFSGMFALGLVMYTRIQSDVHLNHILFGDMLGVSASDILETGIIAVVVTALVVAKRRDLMLHTFDPVHARTVGLRTGWLHYGLLALLSLTIVGALKAVGLVLAIAMLIAPGAIAFLVTRTFGAMLAVAVVVAVLGSLVSVYASFFLDSAPAPTIVVLLSGVFALALLANRRRQGRRERVLTSQ